MSIGGTNLLSCSSENCFVGHLPRWERCFEGGALTLVSVNSFDVTTLFPQVEPLFLKSTLYGQGVSWVTWLSSECLEGVYAWVERLCFCSILGRLVGRRLNPILGKHRGCWAWSYAITVKLSNDVGPSRRGLFGALGLSPSCIECEVNEWALHPFGFCIGEWSLTNDRSYPSLW